MRIKKHNLFFNFLLEIIDDSKRGNKTEKKTKKEGRKLKKKIKL